MKILPITPQIYSLGKSNEKKQDSAIKQVINPIEEQKMKVFAYQDYGVSFTGRTPEDFYAQDFNRNNMPKTMKDYLDFDYEQNQHIPPEQMMREVFKYIEMAEDFDQVKNLYPNEDLFRNLHENNIQSRKGILSEIKVARDLSDAPLLKDGNDDFGMYLLKKIYLEGKTLKEISKDFLEKDLNDEYKGFITEPVQYKTLEAYGIKYPNNAFWHSFIHTRDEYKKFFVTLPKNTYIPGVNTSAAGSSAGRINNPSEAEQLPLKRKYTIKQLRKSDIIKDITTQKTPDEEAIKKAVVKRFGKNDPEASFIVKYMSPIMTVAAERIHLSQEMKAFALEEQLHGKASAEKTMFGRFWKQNPDLLENFSYAITDTIDMFEDIYGGGGNIAINSDLKKITPSSEKQTIIDFVSQEYLDLLDYAQNIDVERNREYERHDELQKQWEEHFIERYGSTVDEIEPMQESAQVEEDKQLTEREQLEIEARKNNAQIYSFVNKSGEDVNFVVNLDEIFQDELKAIALYVPSKYGRMFEKAVIDEGVSEKFKLTLAIRRSGEDIEDPRLLSKNEFEKQYMRLGYNFHLANHKLEAAARMAMADILLRHVGTQVDTKLYNVHAFEYEYMINNAPDDTGRQVGNILLSQKKEINKLYDEYSKPLSKAEINKIASQIIESLKNFDPDKTSLVDSDNIAFASMLKDMMGHRSKRQAFKVFLGVALQKLPYSRTVLNKDINKEHVQARCEQIVEPLLYLFVKAMSDRPFLVTMLNNDVYQKYKSGFTDAVCTQFDNAISKLDFHERRIFMSSHSDLALLDKFL